MLEDTLTGGGTSHIVNGIIVQPRVYGPTPQVNYPVGQPVLKKDKKKSIFIDDLYYVPIYNSGARQIVTNVQEYSDIDKIAFAKTFIWFLTRKMDEVQFPVAVSSWTGFNIQVNMGKDIIPDINI